MTMAPGTRLGPYEIIAPLGAGGMGEVYRARDTRLGREVAVKVLPSDFSADGDRLHRFEQEACAAGALNHPNILSIYDTGAHHGSPYVVSELLEGQTLRQRLSGTTLPTRKAIDYALQIAHGLAAAHEKGIVHRDLKPENLFVTNDGRVKILDFGLAKLTGTDGDQSQTSIPTRRVDTDPGKVMGTAGYMSPEQVKGRPVDHRSDIFSFGAILYEMLSGKRAFRGGSMAETASAILREDPPDLSETNQTVSPALERLVRHCLEKNPAERFHSARDLAFAIESLSGSAITSGATNLSLSNSEAAEAGTSILRIFGNAPMAWIIAAVCLTGLLVALAFVYFNRSRTVSGAMRLNFIPPPELSFNDVQSDAVVISPDGQNIAFSADSADGKNMLYVRRLDSTEARVVPGSENPIEPFWSPDSRSIAFGSDGKLKRSDLSGGNAQILCDAARLVGGSWSKDGVIVFAPDYRTRLVQVSAKGGEPGPLPMNAKLGDDERHRFPYFLPDGRHFLFHREVGDRLNPTTRAVFAASLDSPELKQILADNSNVIYAPQGFLIFVRNDSLVAQAFDVSKLELSGDVIPIITGQATRGYGAAWSANNPGLRQFSVSDTGVILWQGVWQRDYQLVWFDREGKQTGAIDSPVKVDVGQAPRLSPDGKRLAVQRNSNLWAVDLDKGTALRITSSFSQFPVWSPDGNRIVFSGGNGGLTVKAANGLGDEELLLRGPNFPSAWSPDGRFILYVHRGVKTRRDLWVYPTFGDKKEYVLLNSAFDEYQPKFSPNGRWLAYASDETGTFEIYVQSFSADGKLGSDKKRISTTGGMFPVWRADGSELFFVAADGRMMSAAVKTGGPEFEFETPKPLFKTRMLARPQIITNSTCPSMVSDF